jgi:prolyl-tRNA synthetase
VKFKDADLIGVPHRITLGGKKLALGLVELADRKSKQSVDVPVNEVIGRLR